MSGNQGSDPVRGYQRTYEERAATIQQHLRHLLDEHSRLGNIVRDSRPSAQDDVTRLVRLHAKIRPAPQLIRNYIVEYLQADAEWDRNVVEFRLHDDASDWAQRMLQQRSAFYQGLSLALTPLDFLFARLLQDVQRTLNDIESFFQTAPSGEDPARPDATTPSDPERGTAATQSVTAVNRTRTTGSDATHSVARTRSSPTHSVGTTRNQTSGTSHNRPSNPHPSDHDQHSNRPREATNTIRGRTFVNSSYRRSGTVGIMGTTDADVANAIPLAWKPTYDHESARGTSQLYAVASPPAPTQAGPPTLSVGHPAAETQRPSVQPRPQRKVDPEHQRRLQAVLASALPPGGRGPSNATSSNRLEVGADGRPFNSNAAGAAEAAPDNVADFGEDFALENSSKFYQNATFKRHTTQANTAPPPLVLKEVPLIPFDGNIRSYPEFRNRFLEIVEAHRNLEPRHKLQHILHYLRGTPLQMAEGFPFTDESYYTVIDLLENKYGNRSVLQNLLMQDIMNLPMPRMTVADLQLFHDKAFRTISNLRQLGPGYGPDPVLVQFLLGKLPPAMKAKILELHQEPDANALLKGIRDYVSSTERISSAGLCPPRPPQVTPTTFWSGPPGRFNQQNQPRNAGRQNNNYASNNLQFYAAEFTAPTAKMSRIKKAKKKSKSSPASKGAAADCRAPEGRGHTMPCPPRQQRKQQDHSSIGDGGDRDPVGIRSREGSSLNTLNRRARCDLPADRDRPFVRSGQPAASRVRSAKCEAETGNSPIKKTKSTKRTASGPGGTPRPTTSLGKSSNPQGATAYGDDGRLLGHRQTLSADKGSNRTGTAQNTSTGRKPRTGRAGLDNSRSSNGDVDLRSNEEVLIQKPRKTQRCRVPKLPAAPLNRFKPDVGPTAQPTPITSTAVLLECVTSLASAPDVQEVPRQMRTMRVGGTSTPNGSSGSFRDVTVFFDSGSSQTCMRRELAEDLQLKHGRPVSLRVNTFGTRPPVAVKGIDTTITLWTTDYRPITFDALVVETLVSSVTAALVEETDLPLLRLGLKPIRPACVIPDILIGQDLVHLFDRLARPSIPHGFYVVGTNIGTMIGGTGQTTIDHGRVQAPTYSEAALRDPPPMPRRVNGEPGPQASSTGPNLTKPTADPLTTRDPAHAAGDRTEPPPLPPTHSVGSGKAGPTELQTNEAMQMCPLCSLQHQVTACFTYPSIQKRLRRVLQTKLCLLCLTKGHQATSCPSRKASNCDVCQHEQHHPMLCKDLYPLYEVDGCHSSDSGDSTPFEEANPEESSVPQHILLPHQYHQPQEAKNPLDLAEPPLPASSTFTDTSSKDSLDQAEIPPRNVHREVELQPPAAALSVHQRPNSRKTRLGHLSEDSDKDLGCQEPREPRPSMLPAEELLQGNFSRPTTSAISRNPVHALPSTAPNLMLPPPQGNFLPSNGFSTSQRTAESPLFMRFMRQMRDMRQRISGALRPALELAGSRRENLRGQRSPQRTASDSPSRPTEEEFFAYEDRRDFGERDPRHILPAPDPIPNFASPTDANFGAQNSEGIEVLHLPNSAQLSSAFFVEFRPFVTEFRAASSPLNSSNLGVIMSGHNSADEMDYTNQDGTSRGTGTNPNLPTDSSAAEASTLTHSVGEEAETGSSPAQGNVLYMYLDDDSDSEYLQPARTRLSGKRKPWSGKPPEATSAEAATSESTPPTTHSVGKEQAEEEQADLESKRSESSTDSDSSPSEDEADKDAAGKPDHSASSPSESEEALPTTSAGKYSTPRLMPRVSARTIDALRAEVTARYQDALSKWDKNTHGSRPPIAFTKSWYAHEFCKPFVDWYCKMEPIVAARQEEDRRQRQAEEDEVLGAEREAEPASQDVVTEEQAAQLLEEPSPAIVVPSIKPVKTAPPKTTPAHSVGRSSSAGTAPTHSVGPTASKTPTKGEPQRKTIADLKRRGDPSASRSSRSSTGSKRSREPADSSQQPPTKDARRGDRLQSRSLSPNMVRHKDRVDKKTRRYLVPLLDGYTSKEMAVFMASRRHTVENWEAYLDQHNKYELLGLINHFGVPASYLPAECVERNSTGATERTPLVDITFDQLRIEETIIPWNFILGTTLGAYPPYWKQCNTATRKHLTAKLRDSSTYRDIKICGIGPVGFDLRGLRADDTKEYHEQRQNLIRYARIARKARKSLVILIQYDELPTHTHSVHTDALEALTESDASSRQRIHLVANKARAIELVAWLGEYPRTLFSFDVDFLQELYTKVSQPNPDIASQEYLEAKAMKDFLTDVPLEHIVLHSGCPQPMDAEGNCKAPAMLKQAAMLLHWMTGTPADTIHANNAFNLVHFYNLDLELLRYSVTVRDYRDVQQYGQRLAFEALDAKVSALYDLPPRAVRIEQELQKRRARSADTARDEAMDTGDTSRRSRSPRTHGRRSPSDHRSYSSRRKDRKKDRRSSSLTHSAGRKPYKGRGPQHSPPGHSPARSPSSSTHHRRSPSPPNPTKFVVNLDLDPLKMDFPPTKPPTQSSSRLEGRLSRPGSHLDGRVAQGGLILPMEPYVRKTIKELKDTFGEGPPKTVRQQLHNLRKKQAPALTHSVGAANTSAPTHSVGLGTTVIKCPDMRLLKIPPEFETDMFPEEPTPNEVYNETLKFLKDEPDSRGLRNASVASVASAKLEPAQPELFQVPSPGDELCPFDPFYECPDADNEHADFHRTVAAFGLVHDGYWKNKKGMKTKENQALLEEVKKLKVRTLQQMTYLKYGTRLRSNHETRTPNALRFVHAVLTAEDPRRDLPQILLRLKPTFTDAKTRDAWPAPIDYQRAVEHWSCYCVNANVYVMDHLSGPILWGPDWFQEDLFPPGVRRTWRVDLVNDGVGILNELRHQVYRQYSLEHIKAIAEQRKEFVWRRFDDNEDLRVPLGIELQQPITVFVDQSTWDVFQHGLRDGVEMILVNTTSLKALLNDIHQYFPTPTSEKVVFWFGLNYLHAGSCYGRALAEVCYLYAKNFGRVEQYAILPSYIRNKRQAWTNSALVTYLQRQDILPFARVYISPLDLRAWERDERELQENGQLRAWDTTQLDEDGHFHDDILVAATKNHLKAYHDLDLWLKPGEVSKSKCPTDQATAIKKPPTSDHHHTSSAQGSMPTTATLDTQMPSGSGTHSVPALDPNLIAAALAEQLLAGGATGVAPTTAISTATFVTQRVLARAAELALEAAQPRLDSLHEQLRQSRRSREESDHSKDPRSRSRQDQDRGPRK